MNPTLGISWHHVNSSLNRSARKPHSRALSRVLSPRLGHRNGRRHKHSSRVSTNNPFDPTTHPDPASTCCALLIFLRWESCLISEEIRSTLRPPACRKNASSRLTSSCFPFPLRMAIASSSDGHRSISKSPRARRSSGMPLICAAPGAAFTLIRRML